MKKLLWALVFCLLVMAVGTAVALPKSVRIRNDLREQLGIKKLPTTEWGVLQYTGIFLKQGHSPDWSGINKALIRKTFQAAFDKKGKIKLKWVEHFRRILKESDSGTLSNPIPPRKKDQPWSFFVRYESRLIDFTLVPTIDPINITGHSYIGRDPRSKSNKKVISN